MKTKDHPAVNHGKQGVLLINLGTPDSLKLWDIRRYLKEFLSDRRVIELNPIIWQPILRGIILNTRPFKTRRAYSKIWMKETDESPLRYYTRRQAELLNQRIDNSNIIVDWAMRYGNPSIKSRIHSLQQQGCESIVVLPLYPQYCAATTATVCDEVFRVLQKMRWQPQVQIVPRYYDHPAYIQLCVQLMERQLERLEWKIQCGIAKHRLQGRLQKIIESIGPFYQIARRFDASSRSLSIALWRFRHQETGREI